MEFIRTQKALNLIRQEEHCFNPAGMFPIKFSDVEGKGAEKMNTAGTCRGIV